MRIGPSAAHQYYKTSVAAGDAQKISIDIGPMLPPLFLQGGKMSQILAQNFDPNRLWTAVFLKCGALSEIKNNLVKDR